MPSRRNKRSPASHPTSKADMRRRAAARLTAGRARAVDAAAVSVDYAIDHPFERVVVQGPRYPITVPGLESSKIPEDDMKRLLRAVADSAAKA